MSSPSITPLYTVFSHKLNSAWNSRHTPQCFSTDSKRWTFLLCKKCRTGNRSNPHIHRNRVEHLQAKFLTLPKRLWLPPVVVWRRRSRRRKSSYRRTSNCSNYIIRYRASFLTPNILWIYWVCAATGLYYISRLIIDVNAAALLYNSGQDTNNSLLSHCVPKHALQMSPAHPWKLRWESLRYWFRTHRSFTMLWYVLQLQLLLTVASVLVFKRNWSDR